MASDALGLIAWPLGSPALPGLAAGASRRMEAPDELPTKGRVFGVSSLAGSSRTMALTAADSLHHAHVIGPTGVGKSTLLANLALGDLEAGRALVLVDPKGDLVREVADRMPANRQRNVVLLDPVDERPVGLNLLHDAYQAPERTADAVIAIFHRLYASSWGPRTGDVLHAALLTLAQAPGMTLCELPAVLTNDAFRRKLTARLNDQVLLGFWAWYDQLSPGDRAATLGPVMNKLRPLLLRRRLRSVIGQAEPGWQLDDVLNHGGVLLVNLSRGELGSEAAQLLGSILVAQLWQSIQRRAIRVPAMVLIDEFQDVINLPTDLGEVLAQARGFGIGLTLAHQHLGQLDPRMRASVLANARSKVVFQAAADDAAALAKQLGGGLSPSDLMGLGAHQAYLAACLGGRVLPPASLRTLPLPASLGTYEQVRRSSRERYGQDRDEVEAAIADRQGLGQPATAPTASPGRRRRSA
ncbi:MAG: type IV secretion system DNA-binding domain-containing protein [Actinobacteria bacterium]|nr:type IV secretion system DNA-binding domain-containing protein [Actinomycetota bacterium]